MENLPIGYLSCRSCGSIENCADLVSGLCPVCRRERAAHLAQLQSEYQEALQAGGLPGLLKRGLRVFARERPYKRFSAPGVWYIHRPPIVAPGPSCARPGMNLGDFRKGD